MTEIKQSDEIQEKIRKSSEEKEKRFNEAKPKIDIMQEQVNRMYQGSREDTLNGIKSNSTYLVANAILAGMILHERSPEFIQGLLTAKSNPDAIMGWSIEDGARAALDVCGVEKYQGNSDHAKQLIACKFEGI